MLGDPKFPPEDSSVKYKKKMKQIYIFYIYYTYVYQCWRENEK